MCISVLRGQKELPDRSDADSYFEKDRAAREALYEIWSKPYRGLRPCRILICLIAGLSLLMSNGAIRRKSRGPSGVRGSFLQ
jgi:hypothetical protein